MNNYDLIKQLFNFNDLNFEDLNNKFQILNKSSIVDYNAGDIILSATESPIGIGIIVSGRAMISTSAQEKSPILRVLTNGDTFGAASLFGKRKDYSTTVIAETKTSVVYISEENIRELCYTVPQVAINYIEFLSNRVAFLNSKVSTFSVQTSDARIAYYIYTLAEGEEKTLTLPCTYSQIAENLSIGRASLYRAFDTLCKQNIIKRDHNKITILSINQLKKIFNK